MIETVAKVSQQLAHVTGQSQLLHFENKVLREIALLIIEEHEPGRKIQNIKKKSTPNIPGGDENSYIRFNLKEKVYLFELRF